VNSPAVLALVLPVPPYLGGEFAIAGEPRDALVLPPALRLALRSDTEQQLIGAIIAADFVEDMACR
jgi:hypothetical protein